MAVDDFLDAEVGLAVAATAAVLSPRVRGVLRRGAVYGVAGVIAAGEAVTSAAKNVGGAATEKMSRDGGDGHAAPMHGQSGMQPTQ
jgi:hypothetical protein